MFLSRKSAPVRRGTLWNEFMKNLLLVIVL
nr:MAG TPA: hypothetical protein [Caudoviricetes sp.]